ncbi:hypothetical protein M3193_13650 [Sporosarcina luteola]|uniref:hypothetical protein n=1 Tax=Sporosarcina luteola TaxID=582850 RepID=UPI00203FF74B|nr:hypothetical protein [Sporosarcina luteola]MCM3745179.1 hypothetical protein [Sporosarcina luteola]
MKRWLSYLFYFVTTIAVTYVFQLVILFYISGMRFTAADRSPTVDIDIGAKIMFSIGIPVFYFIGLIIFFFFYRSVLELFKIELKNMLPICFNTFITLCLIVLFTRFAFDFSFFH